LLDIHIIGVKLVKNMKFIAFLLIVFNISTYGQGWQVVGQMRTPVSGGQAIVHDSLIYIFGGFSEAQNTNLDLIQVYNPRTNSWKVAGNMNYPRADFIAGADSNRVIYMGGISSDSSGAASLESWNFSSSPSVLTTNDYFSRVYSTGQIIGNNIYVFGGTTQDTVFPYMYSYNLSTDNVINYTDTLYSISFPTQQMSAVYNNYIYLFGGARNLLLKSIYKYDIINNKMFLLSNELDHPRAGGTAVVLNGIIFIIGGFNETNNALSSVDIIRVGSSSSEVEDGPSLNYARRDPMAVNYYGSIYVFGGTNTNGLDVPYIEVFSTSVSTVVNQSKPDAPNEFKLDDNYPNPFNPSTRIDFEVPKQSKISLDIYSILGEHIKNLTSKIYEPGKYTLTWNGTGVQGKQVSSGVYIYRLSSSYYSKSKKMILLK